MKNGSTFPTPQWLVSCMSALVLTAGCTHAPIAGPGASSNGEAGPSDEIEEDAILRTFDAPESRRDPPENRHESQPKTGAEGQASQSPASTPAAPQDDPEAKASERLDPREEREDSILHAIRPEPARPDAAGADDAGDRAATSEVVRQGPSTEPAPEMETIREDPILSTLEKKSDGTGEEADDGDGEEEPEKEGGGEQEKEGEGGEEGKEGGRGERAGTAS